MIDTYWETEHFALNNIQVQKQAMNILKIWRLCTKFFEGLTYLRLWQINFKGGWQRPTNYDPNGTVASLLTSDHWKTLSVIDKSIQQLLLYPWEQHSAEWYNIFTTSDK